MARKYKVNDSPIHGRGVFAARPLVKGEKVIDYKGLLRTHAQSDKLYGDTLDSGHTFLFTLNERYVIDANVDGNDARWINHSCAPNCEALLEEDESGDKRRDSVEIWTKGIPRAAAATANRPGMSAFRAKAASASCSARSTAV